MIGVDTDRVTQLREKLDNEITDDIYSVIDSERKSYFSIVGNDPEQWIYIWQWVGCFSCFKKLGSIFLFLGLARELLW